MSDVSKAKTPTTKSEKSSTSDTSKKADSASSDGAKSTGTTAEPAKSGRESMGGASAVHYGFFSNVKTEEYRSGWDAIWGDKGKQKTKSKPKTKSRAKNKAPVLIDLDFDDLPSEVQEGLAEAARVQLKKSRVNYDNRAKARAVSWRIECDVKR